MDNLEKLLFQKVRVELTKEELSYVVDALHSHKRSEMDYLLRIMDSISEEKFHEFRRKINEKHERLIEKLFEASE